MLALLCLLLQDQSGDPQPAVWLQLLLKLCASSDLETCRLQAQQRLAAHLAGRCLVSAWRQQMPASGGGVVCSMQRRAALMMCFMLWAETPVDSLLYAAGS
jgi:hypothetical protein